jgi:predicted nucleotidyltransferase
MPRLDLPPQYRARLEALLDTLAPGLTVWAYGSRVDGTSHEGSDLDLVLRTPGNPSRQTESLPRIRAALAESDLPILVDLMDWAVLPDAFREEIEKNHVVIREGRENIKGQNPPFDI